MPNHVSHVCSVTGPTEDLARFRHALFSSPNEKELFDFDKIIPMPDVLKDAEESSAAEFGLQLVIARASNTRSFFDKNIAIPNSHWQRMVEETGAEHAGEVAKRYLEKHPDYELAGQKRLRAIAETGYSSWYPWAIANWGTKWGSYSVRIVAAVPDLFTFEFQTAWSCPEPIFAALVTQYSTLTFELKAFDEGWNFACEGQLGANVDEPFSTVEPSDELYEAVYGCPPEREEPAAAVN